MINELWCDWKNILIKKTFCSPNLEYFMIICRTIWLPKEFSAVIVMAVHIPPDIDLALTELLSIVNIQETA